MKIKKKKQSGYFLPQSYTRGICFAHSVEFSPWHKFAFIIVKLSIKSCPPTIECSSVPDGFSINSSLLPFMYMKGMCGGDLEIHVG